MRTVLPNCVIQLVHPDLPVSKLFLSSVLLILNRYIWPVTRNDKTVQVEIYSDSEIGCILEVVDESNNSTVWMIGILLICINWIKCKM